MSVFDELLPKLLEISANYKNDFNNLFKESMDRIHELEKEAIAAKQTKAKNKSKLQIIDELETPEAGIENDGKHVINQKISQESSDNSSTESNKKTSQQPLKKRSKDDVDGILSPEYSKRRKRTASVKAQSIISQQVNVNLTQKLRRKESTSSIRSCHTQSHDIEDKENMEPLISTVHIKEEKVSLPPESEPMVEELPVDLNIVKHLKVENDMPPPTLPVPKSRKARSRVAKCIEKSSESSNDETVRDKRKIRAKEQHELMLPPPIPSARSTRASSRTTRLTLQADSESQNNSIVEPRPKRTRGKKQKVDENAAQDKINRETIVLDTRTDDVAMELTVVLDKDLGAQGKCDVEDVQQLGSETQSIIEIKDAKQPDSETQSEPKIKDAQLSDPETQNKPEVKCAQRPDSEPQNEIEEQDQNKLENENFHTPKHNMNETVVLDRINRDTIVIEKQQSVAMDATVILDKGPRAVDMTEDNSLLTDDNSVEDNTVSPVLKPQPTSAVKEKVQQFEELAASRTTRTKTRAMAKQEEQSSDKQTPPDKVIKQNGILSTDTLAKMNSMIFNANTPQMIVGKKPNKIPSTTKSQLPLSTSKISALNKTKEITKEKENSEERIRKEKEDAKKKKEAILEARREEQKRKREEKMAAAAATREAAERDRRLAMEAACRERQEKQAHADQEKLERQREAERKKLEQARKVMETEERRKAEQARQQKLLEEQKRAEANRKKQQLALEAARKEEMKTAREMEMRKKEYREKQLRLKLKLDGSRTAGTPLRTVAGVHTPGGSCFVHQMEPVYMEDDYKYLKSDEDEEDVTRPAPAWSTSKLRLEAAGIQSCIRTELVDKLFSVGVESPDLREIFPTVEKRALKRTSSAVWRTPPQLR